MSTPEPTPQPGAGDYTWIAKVQINKWDEALQVAVEGWQLDVRWTRSGTILRVFVPLAQYNAANVDSIIRQAGATDDAVSALGGRTG